MVDRTSLFSSLYDRVKVSGNLVPRSNALEYRLSRFNRFRNIEMDTFHAENYRGHVFITKPQLNLSDMMLKYDELLSTLITNTDSSDPDAFDPRSSGDNVSEISQITNNSLPFSIKCNLDSRYFIDKYKEVQTSTVVNSYTPFIVPLYNAIEDISGYPDPILETETRPTGFHQEDQTYALGYDHFVRSYDLSLTFNEIESDYISYMIYMWIVWMGLARKGIITPYPHAIVKRYLCYTCSIYRIITDSTDNRIKHWSKATGCFPKSVPYGNIFNMASGEAYNTTTRQITIPFATNMLEYDNPYILMDFNRLVDRYLAPISNLKVNLNTPIVPKLGIGDYNGLVPLSQSDNLSHLGVPFINSSDQGYTLSWLAEIGEYEEFKDSLRIFGTRDLNLNVNI